LDSAALEQTLSGASDSITKLSVTPNGFYVAAIDEAGNGYTWDLSKGNAKSPPVAKPLPKHPGATGALRQIRFDPEGGTLWASGDFPNLVRWTVDIWKPAGEVRFATSSPNRQFAISADGKYAIAATENSYCTAIRKTEESDFEPSVRVEHKSGLTKIERVLPVGADYFALLGGDGAIEFWRGRDDQYAGQFPAQPDGVTTVTYAHPLKMTLTGHADGSISLWSVDGLRERPENEQWEDVQTFAKLLKDKKFDELTDKIDALRRERAFYKTGMPKLYVIYSQLGTPENHDWSGLHELLAEWRAAKPKSIAPLIAEAEALKCEGWEARGSGWASTVSGKGWEVFGKKLHDALDVIADAEKLDEKDPELYHQQLGIYMGISQPLDDQDAALKTGIEIDPSYFPLYTQAAIARLPRWGGRSPARLAKWAGEFCDDLNDRGDEAYAYIAIELVRYPVAEFFGETELDWDRIKRGLDKLLAAYDDSEFIANSAGYLAVLKFDHPMAAKTLPILGLNRKEAQIWGTESQPFYRWQKWAQNDKTQPPAEQDELRSFPKGISCATLAVKGRMVVVTGPNCGGQLQIYEPENWLCGYNRQNLGTDFLVLAVHPKQPIIAIAGGPLPQNGQRPNNCSSGLEVCDFSEGQPKSMMLSGHTDVVKSLAFAPDGSKLATGGLDSSVRLWNVPLTLGPSVLSQPSGVAGIAFTADSKTLLVATLADGVLNWDSETQQQSGKLPNSSEKYTVEQGKALACSNEGALVAYLNGEGRVEIYDLQAKKSIATLPRIEGGTCVLAFSPDDKLIATGGESGKLQLWNAQAGNLVHTYLGHADAIRSISFFPDGSKVMTLSDDATIRVWDLSKATP
jgi:WD40 repeat protein